MTELEIAVFEIIKINITFLGVLIAGLGILLGFLYLITLKPFIESSKEAERRIRKLEKNTADEFITIKAGIAIDAENSEDKLEKLKIRLEKSGKENTLLVEKFSAQLEGMKERLGEFKKDSDFSKSIDFKHLEIHLATLYSEYYKENNRNLLVAIYWLIKQLRAMCESSVGYDLVATLNDIKHVLDGIISEGVLYDDEQNSNLLSVLELVKGHDGLVSEIKITSLSALNSSNV